MESLKSSQPLLTSYSIGDIILPNRVIMAPLTRSRADNHENAPTKIHTAYYGQRASAGLIISEGAQISKRAVGYINTPGIHTKAQVEGWKKVTQSVHKKGGRIFCQLWHVGRMSHPDFHNGNKPIAPSAINPNAKSFTPEGFKDTVTPKAMSLIEIEQTLKEYRLAARNAKEAGFDGVEIHASNGYLIHQFLNRPSNNRKDRYGGSIENRARFLFEVITELKKSWNENRIGVRLNPSLHDNFGMQADEETIPTFEHVVKQLNAYNLGYLHLSEPFNDISHVDFLVTDIAKHFRPLYNGTLMINSNFNQEKGNRIIQEGYADLVAYGKLYIANPDLPKRFALNAPLNKWDQQTFYTPGTKGYTDYPFLGDHFSKGHSPKA